MCAEFMCICAVTAAVAVALFQCTTYSTTYTNTSIKMVCSPMRTATTHMHASCTQRHTVQWKLVVGCLRIVQHSANVADMSILWTSWRHTTYDVATVRWCKKQVMVMGKIMKHKLAIYANIFSVLSLRVHTGLRS